MILEEHEVPILYPSRMFTASIRDVRIASAATHAVSDRKALSFILTQVRQLLEQE